MAPLLNPGFAGIIVVGGNHACSPTMAFVWEFGMLLLLVAILVGFLAPRLIRRGPRADRLNGTLLVTGVSPRPDADGQQFVTISGVIDGPTVNEHAVYQRMVVDVDHWPTVGELMPVVYSQRNPDNWTFTPPEN
jgi:hypothetical protein